MKNILQIKELKLPKIKINNKILHQSKLINYFNGEQLIKKYH